MKPIRSESKEGIATITFARPEQLNALNFETVEALVEALDAVAAGDDRVLVLAAEGPAFCAGADRAEMIERKP
ncbi:MAG: enoyl-CoA hydratase/isomerase family protein, partial [Myxococcota bacterium]